MTYRRLPLEGAKNVRDLGGYPVPGGVTRFNRFIRSESPRGLTGGDLEFIKSYGVTVSIDFRGDNEVKRHPSRLEGVPWIKYVRCPTFDRQLAFAAGIVAADGRPSINAFVDWGEKYISLLENGKNWVRDTLRVMAGAQGAVIFNCTTGKDRAGVMSALLLSLAGVCDADIIADYCVSELYLTEIYEELLAEYRIRRPDEKGSIDSPFFRTSRRNMATLLDYLNGRYGRAGNYIKECGVDDRDITALRERLVGD